MNSKPNKTTNYSKIANIISLLCISLYGLMYIFLAIKNSDFNSLITAIVLIISVFTGVHLVMLKIKDKRKLALYIPLIFFFWFLYIGIFRNGTLHFFVVFFSLCGLSSLYFDFKNFCKFVIISNIIIFIVVHVFNIPILGPSISIVSLNVNWAISMFGVLFLLIVSNYSTNRHIQSVKSKDIFDTLLATTPNIIAIVDDLNCITHISSTLAVLAHIQNPELAMGRPILDLFHNPEIKILISDTLNAEGYYEETREVLFDDNPHWLKVISDEMLGDTKGRFIDINDVTDIMKAKVAAEKGTQAKNDFLAKMSHEIRTPMNAIIGMSELILRENLPAVVHEYSMNIKQASTNLVSIINDILDFTKIEAGKMEIIETDYLFSSMVNDIISIIRMKIIEKPILFATNIDCHIPNNLVGDEIRIRQIILNLLSNAYKYCNEGFVSLSISCNIISDTIANLHIEVADSGIGIKEEDLDSLFKDFAQIDMLKNKGIEGTGLGLSIAKNLCRDMGGDISVKSTYGKGSVFTINLPQKYTSNQQFANVYDVEAKNVLVYETRDVYATSIILSLENLGVPCTLVNNQSDVYQKLKTNNYSHIFISSFLLDSIRRIIEKFNLSTRMVLLVEFGEHLSISNVRTIPLPIHAISIANVLNDVADENLYSENIENVIKFISPTTKVLIVDDISTNLKVAEGLMLPYKMQIDVCTNGIEAIELVKHNNYDLVFMDHMMPLMDGIEATLRIRNIDSEDDYYKSLPIIALTANAVSGVKEMFLLNGFNDFLAKPIEVSKLNTILETWVPNNKKEKNRDKKEDDNHFSFNIDGIDVKIGITMTGGNTERYIDTLSVFYSDGKEKIEQIKNCFHLNDLNLYATYVHALKSAMGSIGALELSDYARTLEMAAKSEDVLYLNNNTETFLSAFNVLLENIYTALLQLGAAKETKNHMNEALLNQKLLELKFAIEAMDTNISDVIISELKNTLLSDDIILAIDTISQNILLCDYEDAVRNIDVLMKSTKI